MDEEIKKRLDLQDELLRKIYISAEKTRKYFLTTIIITIITIALPLIALIFLLPWIMNTYISTLGTF